MDGAKGVNKLVLVKRLAEIRVLLSVKVEKAAGLELDFTNKSACIDAIQNYFDNEFNSLPKALQITEARTLVSVHALVNSIPGDATVSVSSYNKIQAIANSKPEETPFDYFSNNGRFFDGESGYAQVILEHYETVNKEPIVDAPGVNMQKAEIIDLIDTNNLNRNKLLDKLDWHNNQAAAGAEISNEVYLQLDKEQNDLYIKIIELKNLYSDVNNKKYVDKQARMTAILDKLKDSGQVVIDTLLSASSVTQEQADQWAKEQSIDKTSSAKLSKNGYKTADVRRDMAEFYRISGGKLRNIAIISDGSKRANAGGIGQVEGMQISIDSNFNKETLWHEMAHHLEADPAAAQAAKDFLIKRRESETVYSLRSLTGNKGYKKDEGAYKDKFIHEYIGKVYNGPVSEVWAMGVQYLSNPQQAAMFIAKDPEMASLIAGYLQAELTPAMKALKQVQGMTADGNQTKRDDVESQYQDAIKRLSAGVEIVDDGWFDSLDLITKRDVSTNYGTTKNTLYLGSWGKYKFFSGKFKSKKTKRMSKGYAVSETLNDSFIHLFPIIEDLPTVKAIIKISDAEKGSVSNVYYTNYIFSSDHKGFIYTAKKILEGNL